MSTKQTEFLPALKGGANLAGPASGPGETFSRARHNAQAWAEIVDFLITQELARLGLGGGARPPKRLRVSTEMDAITPTPSYKSRQLNADRR
ncbi:MAG: hypothetical protein P4N59_11370, partial [Negativicutes bacterium]|nr:hypothetical protein [Negativicutes bacterium]